MLSTNVSESASSLSVPATVLLSDGLVQRGIKVTEEYAVCTGCGKLESTSEMGYCYTCKTYFHDCNLKPYGGEIDCAGISADCLRNHACPPEISA